MSKKSNDIIKKVLLMATASFMHTNYVQASNYGEIEKSKEFNLTYNRLKNRITRNVLKISSRGRYRLIQQHFSHSSHSSHSSHASHFSSAGTSQPSPTTSQDYSTNSVYSAGGSVRGARSKNQFSPVSSQKDASLYKLGDRTLKKGMFGNDVDELSKLLIALNYLKVKDCVKQKGFSFFDEKMEDAIKRFQSDHNMRDTGIVDSNLVSILKKQEH